MKDIAKITVVTPGQSTFYKVGGPHVGGGTISAIERLFKGSDEEEVEAYQVYVKGLLDDPVTTIVPSDNVEVIIDMFSQAPKNKEGVMPIRSVQNGRRLFQQTPAHLAQDMGPATDAEKASGTWQ